MKNLLLLLALLVPFAACEKPSSGVDELGAPAPKAAGPITLPAGTYQACGPSNVTFVVGPCPTATATATASATASAIPTAAPTIAPSPVPTAAPVVSPEDTVVLAGVGGAITDLAGRKWTITSGGQVAVNGVADATTSGVIELAWVGGVVWQKNSNNLWWGKTSPTAAWLPDAGTAVSPLPGGNPSPSPISSPSGAPSATPAQTPAPPVAGLVPMLPVSQTIASLTGSPQAIAAALPNVDQDPTHFGRYITSPATAAGPQGIGMIGGPLLDNRMAASVVMVTPQSKVELGLAGAVPSGHAIGPMGSFNHAGTNHRGLRLAATSKSAANIAADNYYQTVASTAAGQSHYLAELAPFWAAYNDGASSCCNTWGVVARRVDGACPIANPTAAEALQWAANKWGMNPRYPYTEACDEGDWDSTALGDNGTSSGILQLADRGANHAWSGFDGLPSQNLSRESVCFNADFFMASRWASFNVRKVGDSTGLTGETPPFNTMAMTQSWFSGGATASGGTYQQMIWSDFISGWKNAGVVGGAPCWVRGFFNGVAIPMAPPAGTLPHE